MKKAVLFDLDGTLLNSLPDISKCMNAVLEKHHLPTFEQSAYGYLTGNGARKLAQRCAGEAHQHLVDEILEQYSALYAAHCYDDSFLYNGIADMLRALKAAGYRLVVLSNKDNDDVSSVIGHYFPASPFELTRGRLPGVPLKPDPTAAKAIAAQMGVAPEDFWYLGDTQMDYATCQGVGMNFIAAGWGFRTQEELRAAGAQFIAQTPQEALEKMLSE